MAGKTIPKKVGKEIREYVAGLRNKNLPVDSVYLFGSYAKGTTRPFSDIDICVVSPRFTNYYGALQYLWRYRLPNSIIEPIGMSPKDFAEDTTLTREIKRTGIKMKV